MEDRVKRNYSINRKGKENQKNISYLFHDLIVYYFVYNVHGAICFYIYLQRQKNKL